MHRPCMRRPEAPMRQAQHTPFAAPSLTLSTLLSLPYPQVYMLAELEPSRDLTGGAWWVISTEHWRDEGRGSSPARSTHAPFLPCRTCTKHGLDRPSGHGRADRGLVHAPPAPHFLAHASHCVTHAPGNTPGTPRTSLTARSSRCCERLSWASSTARCGWGMCKPGCSGRGRGRGNRGFDEAAMGLCYPV